MIFKLFSVIFLALFASTTISVSPPAPFQEECVHHKYPPEERSKIPNYVIDLDLRAEERWQHIGKERSSQIAKLLTTFKNLFLSVTSEAQHLINFVDEYVGILVEMLPMPYRDEIKGLSKASGLNLGEVFLYNIFYEIFTVCTSIVAEAPDGSLYHARNLDFGLFMGWDPKNHSWEVTEVLRPAVITVDWQRNNKTVFKSVNFAGYIGIVTAIKPGVFTLTMNERFNVDGGYVGIFKWLMGDRSGSWMSFLTRHTLEVATSYQQAKHLLANTTLLAPAYFILGGTKAHEACVITRSREKAVDVWDIGTNGSSWYILETNYDHWKRPLFIDDRRTPAHHCMNNMTQKNVGFAGLFDVLSSRPVLNKLTTYTSLMRVNSGRMETYLQHCPDPCAPW